MSTGAVGVGVVQVRNVRVVPGERFVGREDAAPGQRGVWNDEANVGVVHVYRAGVALVGVSMCGSARGIASLRGVVQVSSWL